MKKYSFLRTLLAGIAVLLLLNPVSAQYDLTIYPMQSIPQSNYSNPALMPDCKLHIGILPVGIPVLPSLYFGVSNSGFAYNQAVRFHKADSSYSVLDLGNVIDKLSKKNYLTTRLQMELFSFGMKIKRTHYFSIGMYEKVNLRVCYPEDLLSMAWYGNSQYIGKEASFDGLGADFMHYRELDFSYTNQIDDKWTIGGRAKVLFGIGTVWTKKTKATLGIHEEYYDFTANSGMDINIGGNEDLMRYLEDTNSGKDFNDYTSFSKILLNTDNLGGAIDIGVSYRLNEKFSFAGSVIDLGSIRFKSGTRNYRSPDTTFVFEGFDLNDWFRKDTSETNQDVLNDLVDSVLSYYQLDTTYEKFWAPLNPVVNLSAFYSPTEKDRVSALARLEIYKGTVHPAFTLGYYRKFGKALSVAVNYSYNNRSWLNVGFGAAVKAGPFQFFVTTDNVLSGIMPYAIRNVNIHFGANLIFYQKNYYPLISGTTY